MSNRNIKLQETMPFSSEGEQTEERVLHNVVLLASRKTKNNRTYPVDVLQRAVGMFENVPAYMNHPDKKRNVQDAIGVYRSPRLEAERLLADLVLFENHPNAGQIMDIARHKPKEIGLSLNARGKVQKTTEGDMVSEIAEVLSVDIVAEPASTRNLFEDAAGASEEQEHVDWATAKEGENSVDYTEITVEALREQRADLLEVIEQPFKQQLAELTRKILVAEIMEQAKAKLPKAQPPAIAKLQEQMNALETREQMEALLETVTRFHAVPTVTAPTPPRDEPATGKEPLTDDKFYKKG